MSLLEFKDVNIIYKKKSEETHAVKDVSLNINSGESLYLLTPPPPSSAPW